MIPTRMVSLMRKSTFWSSKDKFRVGDGMPQKQRCMYKDDLVDLDGDGLVSPNELRNGLEAMRHVFEIRIIK